MKRHDLAASESRRAADVMRASARRARLPMGTGPAGVVDLGVLGDVLWTAPDGERSVRGLPALIAALETGLSTQSRMNTVSTSAPTGSDWPEGALWTRIGIVDGKRAVLGTWQWTSGAWVPLGEDASRLVVGQLDVGLIDVAMLWARLIETEAMVIQAPGIGPRLTLDARGLVLFDPATGDITGLIGAADGVEGDWLAMGATRVGATGVSAPSVSAPKIQLGSRDLAALLDERPRGLIAQWVDHDGRGAYPWTTGWVPFSELRVAVPPNRKGRIVLSGVSGYSNTATSQVRVALFGTYDGSAPNLGSPILADSAVYPPFAGYGIVVPPLQVNWSTFGRTTDTIISVRAYYSTALPTHQVRLANTPLQPNVLAIYDDGGGLPLETGSSPRTEGTAPARQTITREWAAIDAASWWDTSGGWDGGDKAGRIVQGTYNGGPSGARHGLWVFADLVSELAGATINWAEIACRNEAFWASAGGTGRWHYHGYGSLPGSNAGLDGQNYLNDTPGWAPGEWRTLRLSPDMHARLQNGSMRGFGMNARSNQNNLYYGVFSRSDALIRVNYTK